MWYNKYIPSPPPQRMRSEFTTQLDSFVTGDVLRQQLAQAQDTLVRQMNEDREKERERDAQERAIELQRQRETAQELIAQEGGCICLPSTLLSARHNHHCGLFSWTTVLIQFRCCVACLGSGYGGTGNGGSTSCYGGIWGWHDGFRCTRGRG